MIIRECKEYISNISYSFRFENDYSKLQDRINNIIILMRDNNDNLDKFNDLKKLLNTHIKLLDDLTDCMKECTLKINTFKLNHPFLSKIIFNFIINNYDIEKFYTKEE